MTLRIRLACEQDLPFILAIYNDAIVKSSATFDLTMQTLAERQEWFQQFGDYYPLIVAELEGKIAGYCCLTAFRSKAAYARTAELSVYLDDDFQGRGLGSMLLAEIIRLAAARGFHVLVAGITGGNAA
ncbi:MAG: family N-acetyltransferase, partial [Paenibacillus sp.]|nr:family N-acetyltransferase [Paenibacillus sp.]